MTVQRTALPPVDAPCPRGDRVRRATAIAPMLPAVIVLVVPVVIVLVVPGRGVSTPVLTALCWRDPG